MNWINFWEEKINDIAKNSKVILDVGGGRKFQKGMEKYKVLFEDHDYKTLDNVKDYKPDILGDIKQIPLEDNSIDAVICRSVLEHVDEPQKAAREIYRVLKPGGHCLVSVPFLYPYHAEKGYYKDLYRFTEDGVRYLFKDFSQIEICKVRGLFETVTNLMPIKLCRQLLAPIAHIFDSIFKSKNQTSGYNIYLRK